MTQSTTEGVTITDSTNRKRCFANAGDCHSLNGVWELMWKHAQECHAHCLMLERALDQLPGDNFPIIVGRRPASANYSGKENVAKCVLVSN